jgi:hypothetical protein
VLQWCNIALLAGWFVTGISNQAPLLYDLSRPEMATSLPPALHEISGLTELDSASFACVQDEHGILFIYDIRRNRIVRELPFGYDGDYEGVARVGKTVYVLRSDGVLYEIPDYRLESSNTRFYETMIPAENNEGLCYDRAGHRLLIGCKGRLDKGPEFKDPRYIYAFDLKTKKLAPKPVYAFSVQDLSAYAVKNGIIPPVTTKKNGRTIPSLIKLSTSEIALHPVTGELYLLSAADHLLMIFDAKGRIRHMEALDPAVFNKPEGITFFANGDMLITNEGQEGRPSLLKFRYRKAGGKKGKSGRG